MMPLRREPGRYLEHLQHKPSLAKELSCLVKIETTDSKIWIHLSTCNIEGLSSGKEDNH